FLVGLALAAQFLPVLVLSPLAGEIADRYRKRRVLLVTQSSFVVPPLALFVLTATGHAQYWEVVVAALVTGTINALDVPCRATSPRWSTTTRKSRCARAWRAARPTLGASRSSACSWSSSPSSHCSR